MTLKTKCIGADIESEDGIRICIIRDYNLKKDKEYQLTNAHWIELAPSEELLKAFHKKMPWEDYVVRFTKEVISKQTDKIKNLAIMAMEKDVTILGYEEIPEHCHRRLVALACKMYQPDLEVILK